MHTGKDCGIATQYAFVGGDLFVSDPEGAKSEIYSEKVTGLRFAFKSVFQINYHHTFGDGTEVFVPLFSVKREYEDMTFDEKYQFDALKDYGVAMLTNFAMGLGLAQIGSGCLFALAFY